MCKGTWQDFFAERMKAVGEGKIFSEFGIGGCGMDTDGARSVFGRAGVVISGRITQRVARVDLLHMCPSLVCLRDGETYVFPSGSRQEDIVARLGLLLHMAYPPSSLENVGFVASPVAGKQGVWRMWFMRGRLAGLRAACIPVGVDIKSYVKSGGMFGDAMGCDPVGEYGAVINALISPQDVCLGMVQDVDLRKVGLLAAIGEKSLKFVGNALGMGKDVRSVFFRKCLDRYLARLDSYTKRYLGIDAISRQSRTIQKKSGADRLHVMLALQEDETVEGGEQGILMYVAASDAEMEDGRGDGHIFVGDISSPVSVVRLGLMADAALRSELGFLSGQCAGMARIMQQDLEMFDFLREGKVSAFDFGIYIRERHTDMYPETKIASVGARARQAVNGMGRI